LTDLAKAKTIQEYEAEIRELHFQLKDYPDNETIQNKLKGKLSAWQKLVTIVIFRASNEQTGWTEKELGYTVLPMPRQKDSGHPQVADYWFYYTAGDNHEGLAKLIVERKGGKKGCEDLYGTLAHEDNRLNFSQEIDRFKADPRFNQMVIIAECSLKEYLEFTPPFMGKKRNTAHYGMSVPAREATIAGLIVKGVFVFFASTRKRAINIYLNLIRQWLIKNYEIVLKLDAMDVSNGQNQKGHC
jgi:hypothetical protein